MRVMIITNLKLPTTTLRQIGTYSDNKKANGAAIGDLQPGTSEIGDGKLNSLKLETIMRLEPAEQV